MQIKKINNHFIVILKDLTVLDGKFRTIPQAMAAFKEYEDGNKIPKPRS
jgi:hypothetical protein